MNPISQRLGTTLNGEQWGYSAKGEVVSSDHSINTKDCSYLFDDVGTRLQATEGQTTTNCTPNQYNTSEVNPGIIRIDAICLD